MAGGDRIRLFCALRLPAATLDELAAWQARELSGDSAVKSRIVERANLHVTLAFLGSRPRDEVPAIIGELAAAASTTAPISFSADRYRETRTVGMVVLRDEGGAGAALVGDLEARLERLGVLHRERRPWLAHVTVLRFGRPPGLAPAPPQLDRVGPSDAAVYSSVLRSHGAQYEVLESVALGGR